MDNELFQPPEVTAWRAAHERLQQATRDERDATLVMETASYELMRAKLAETEAKLIMLKALAR